MLSEKDIKILPNQWTPLPSPWFEHCTTGIPSTVDTLVQLQYDENFLKIKFECHQNPFVNSNTYKISNSDMWNQEVFEIFISTEADGVPKTYLEFEINPNGAVWIGQIHNPFGNGHIPNETKMIAPENSGVLSQIFIKDDIWGGEFSLPFQLIGKKQPHYKFNFFRIRANKPVPENWSCSPENADFLCYNSPKTGDQPAFHRPAAFVNLFFL